MGVFVPTDVAVRLQRIGVCSLDLAGAPAPSPDVARIRIDASMTVSALAEVLGALHGSEQPCSLWIGTEPIPQASNATQPAASDLGKAVREQRELAGFTQQSLADAAGISVRQVQRIERGDRRTRRSTLDRIAVALDLDSTVVESWIELGDDSTVAPESVDAGDRDARRRRRLGKQTAAEAGALLAKWWLGDRPTLEELARYRRHAAAVEGAEPDVLSELSTLMGRWFAQAPTRHEISEALDRVRVYESTLARRFIDS